MMVDWRALLDSDGFRRFAKHGPGRVVFSSRAYRRANLARHRIIARRAVERDPGRYDQVGTFCVFVGHTKSGASLLGGLLDAHRRIVCSDENDALRYVAAGFRRDEVFHLLERGAAAEARKGRVTARRLQPYSFRVEGQWQGRASAPLVVGDTTSGATTRRLTDDPTLLDRALQRMAPTSVRLIQVIRNPFDPISVMRVRGRRTIANAVEHYFDACSRLVTLRQRLPSGTLLEVRHEDLVADPRTQLATVCGFLGVDADEVYLDACAAIVAPHPKPRHHLVNWTRPWIEEIERRIDSIDFLKGYRYDQ